MNHPEEMLQQSGIRRSPNNYESRLDELANHLHTWLEMDVGARGPRLAFLDRLDAEVRHAQASGFNLSDADDHRKGWPRGA